MRSLRGPWGLWPRAVMKKAFSAGSLSEPWPMPDSWGFLILPSWEGAVPAMNRMSAVWSAFPRPALPWASPMPRTWALPAIRSMPSARPCRRKRSFVPCFAATSWGPLRSRSPRPARTWGASSQWPQDIHHQCRQGRYLHPLRPYRGGGDGRSECLRGVQ